MWTQVVYGSVRFYYFSESRDIKVSWRLVAIVSLSLRLCLNNDSDESNSVPVLDSQMAGAEPEGWREGLPWGRRDRCKRAAQWKMVLGFSRGHLGVKDGIREGRAAEGSRGQKQRGNRTAWGWSGGTPPRTPVITNHTFHFGPWQRLPQSQNEDGGY